MQTFEWQKALVGMRITQELHDQWLREINDAEKAGLLSEPHAEQFRVKIASRVKNAPQPTVEKCG